MDNSNNSNENKKSVIIFHAPKTSKSRLSACSKALKKDFNFLGCLVNNEENLITVIKQIKPDFLIMTIAEGEPYYYVAIKYLHKLLPNTKIVLLINKGTPKYNITLNMVATADYTMPWPKNYDILIEKMELLTLFANYFKKCRDDDVISSETISFLHSLYE